MKDSFKNLSEKFLLSRKSRKNWKKIFMFFAVIVVFGTTYSLILPAITMESDAVCGIEEHQHGAECYSLQLSCEINDGDETHIHKDNCYQEVLVCEKMEHVHNESCYAEDMDENEIISADGNEPDSSDTILQITDSETEANDLMIENIEIIDDEGGSEKVNEEEETEKETESETERDTETVTEEMTESGTEPENIYTYKDSSMTLKVSFPDGCTVPENAVLSVQQIEPENEKYDALSESAVVSMTKKDRRIIELVLYDISFYTPEGTYIPVSDFGLVTIVFENNVFEAPEKEAAVFHYEEEDTPVLLEDVVSQWNEEGLLSQVSFTAPGFSSFAVMTIEEGNGISLMIPVPEKVLASGTFEENDALTWTVTQDDIGVKTLTISGEGAMPDLSDAAKQPWRDYYKEINKIIIEDGVTYIGQYAFKNMAATEINIGKGVTSIGKQAFGYMSSLETITIPGNVKTLGEAFQYSYKIKKVILEEGIESINLDGFIGPAIGSSGNTIDLPSTVKEVKGVYAHTSGYTVAEGNDLFYTDEYGALYKQNGDGTATLVGYPTHGAASSYTVPENVTKITAVFRSNSTLQELIIPDTVTYPVPTQCFRDSNLVRVEFGKTVKLADTTYTFNGCKYLEEVVFPDTITSFNGNTFANCSSLSRVTVGEMVTYIDSSFSGCVGLNEFVYDAKNCTKISTAFGSGLPFYELVIGKNVEVLPGPKTINKRYFGGFSEIAAHAQNITFQGPAYITVEEGALSTAPAPLSTLQGTIFVDENGVIYKYDETTESAVLFFCPDGLIEVEIPDKVLSANGIPCVVSRVEKYAFSTNQSLETLKVADPSLITTIGERAFFGCINLNKIIDMKTGTEATTVHTAEMLFQPVTIGRRAFENTGLTEDLPVDTMGTIRLDEMTGKQNLKIQMEQVSSMNITVRSDNGTMEWNTNKEDGTVGGYHLLTGDRLSATISVGNEYTSADTSYRVYFELTEESGSLDIVPGKTYEIDGQNVTCYATEDSNIVYLDFKPQTGATLNIPVTAIYPNISSSGGGLRIWGFIYKDSVGMDSQKVILPADSTETIQAYWDTLKDEFKLSKESTDKNPVLLTGDGNKGVKLGSDITWNIKLQKEAEQSSYGKDFVSLVQYTDTMEFPAGIDWSEEVKQAVQEGDIRRSGENLYAGNIPICKMHSSTNKVVISKLSAEMDPNNKLAIIFTARKTESNAEMSDNLINATIYADALTVDLDVYDQGTENQNIMSNHISSSLYYNFSDRKELNAEASKTIKINDANVKLQKTASKTTYFGEDVTYTLRVYNEGAAEYPSLSEDSGLQSIRLEDTLDAATYIKAQAIDQMLNEAVHKNLTVTIEHAELAPQIAVTGYDGKNGSWQTSANSNTGTTIKNATLTVSLNPNQESSDNERVMVTVNGIDCYYDSTAEGALRKAGYAVNKGDQYKVTWMLPDGADGFQLIGGEERLFHIYATSKDTFQMLNNDEPNEYPSSSTLTLKNTAAVMENYGNLKPEVKKASSAAQSSVKREVYLGKSVKRNGVQQNTNFSAQDNDLLDYTLTFRHYGGGVYEDLPLVDDMYGVQCLLVSAEKNPHLGALGLKVVEANGEAYYKLTEDASPYSNIVVGVDDEGVEYTAASVTVTRSIDEVNSKLEGYTYTGLHTEIKWYYPELMEAGNYQKEINYKALVDTSLTEGVSYAIGNIVWMNDKNGSRLYDSLWGGGTIIDFDKDIVMGRGDSPQDDQLAEDKYSLIEEGESVTYRLTLTNKGDYDYTLNGSALADALPKNGDVFRWSDSNIDIEVETSGDSQVEVNGIEDQWIVSDQWNNIEGGSDQQYILWPQGKIIFKGAQTVYIYVTLRFPKDNKDGTNIWSNYCDAVQGGMLENTLYVYRYPANVTHKLKEKGEVLLQKGVYGSYYYNSNDGKNSSSKFYETSSRIYYNNKDSRDRAIAYYTVLYNGGNKPLYLNTLYDVLPKGFHYLSLLADSSSLGSSPKSYTYLNTVTTKTEGDSMLTESRSVSDSVIYRSAVVKASTEADYVKFQISGDNGNDSIQYDESQKSYYLDKNEAIVFGYLCDIDESANTEDYAANTVGMSYKDLLESGAKVADTASFSGKTTATYNVSNDGGCSVVNYLDAQKAGMPAAEKGADWLLSDVTVSRGTIVPGIIKYTESYTDEQNMTYPYSSSVKPNVTVNWRTRLQNSGEYSIVDYTFTDIMPSPYVFEGDVNIKICDSNGKNMLDPDNNSSVKLFSIGQRTGNDQVVDFTTYESWGSSIKTTLSLGEEKLIYLRVGNTNCTAKLMIEKDADGNEIMKLVFDNRYLSIPEGGYVDITYSSRNPTTVYKNESYVNQAMLTPNVQNYDHASSGMLVTDETGKITGIKSYSPVTVAFGSATSSEKEVEEWQFNKETQSYQATGNRAEASDIEKNRIQLKSTDSKIRYKLIVSNDSDVQMDKLVLIDNLPEEKDHSVFDTKVGRDSQFKIKLAENPDFQVKIINEGSDDPTILQENQFKVEYSSQTEFGKEDWKGEGTGWSPSVQTDTRSFRIQIIDEDENTVLVPSKSKIEISFDAAVDMDDENLAKLQPGVIAWNSFGYHYQVHGSDIDLAALSLPVGVAMPDIPILQKKLQTENGTPVAFGESSNYSFYVYTGTKLNGSYENEEELTELLNREKEDNTEFFYKKFTVTIPENASESDRIYLVADGWNFIDGRTYTIVEATADSRFVSARWNSTLQNYYTFTYKPNDKVILTCTNIAASYELPETGGSGKLPYTCSGIVLVAGALMYYICRLRRKEVMKH